MTNERLRTALLQRGETPATVAEVLGVDPKTVERWIGGRTPYRRTRYDLARHLEADEAFLWPNATSPEHLASASENELVVVYPHRWAVPRDAWVRLFDAAEEEIAILVYSGLFLIEDAGIMQMLREKAGQGVPVRILIGDPDSPQLSERGIDEGIDDTLTSKVRYAIVLLKPLSEVDGIEIRLHSTTLYNSIYRGDDELLVNTHIFGEGAAQAPVMHLRRVVGGGMVTIYLNSFERVWASARPLPAGM